MNYEENDDASDGFKMGGVDGDEPLDIPEEIPDFGLDDEDPDKDK